MMRLGCSGPLEPPELFLYTSLLLQVMRNQGSVRLTLESEVTVAHCHRLLCCSCVEDILEIRGKETAPGESARWTPAPGKYFWSPFLSAAMLCSSAVYRWRSV